MTTKIVFDLLSDRTVVSSRLVLPNQAVFITRDRLAVVIGTHGINLHARINCVCGQSLSFDLDPNIRCETCGVGWDAIDEFLTWQEKHRCHCDWFPTAYSGGVACPFCANEWAGWDDFIAWKEAQDAKKDAP